MLTVLAIVAIIAAAGIAIILLLAAAKPDTFRIERTATIAAPADRIFPLINDFRNWPSWSPWEKLDPAMTRTLSGAESGKGAVYAWKSAGKAGQGRMEIAQALPPSKIDIDLDFRKPFKAHNVAEFRLEPQGGATKVTWAMHGKSPFAARIMRTVVNMDKMVGRDFEAGLDNLRALAEKSGPR
jgi:uncharacterized protein YndB with AHSA1/START domain